MAKAKVQPEPAAAWWRNPWVGAAALALLVAAVYFPVFNGQLLGDFDDNSQVNNPLVLAADGWWRIWVAPPSNCSPDYFPLTSFVFWIQHQCWGAASIAAGCHTVNIVLHFLNCLLLWRVLKALRIPVPWLVAAVFAVPPGNVPSVAWVAELKNTLSLPFFLAALLAYLRFEDAPAERRGRWYAAALALFVLGCLCKSTLVVTGPVLLLLAWWRRNRITWADALRSLPFWLGGVGFGLLTMLYQYRPNGGVQCGADFLPRGIYLVGHNVWFYLKHMTLPFWNCTVYPAPWSPVGWPQERFALPAVYLPTALAAAAFLVLAWFVWRRNAAAWVRGLFFAYASFLVTMSLVLGVLPTLYLQFSPVADHWQYMSLMAVAGLPVCGVAVLLRRWPASPGKRVLGTGLAAAWLIVLSAAAFPYASAYRNSGTLWADVLRKNPDAWIAYNNYGNWLFDQTKNDGLVLPYFEKAIQLNPAYRDALYNAGTSYYALGRYDEAYEVCRRSNETRPTPLAWTQMGMARRAQKKNEEALACFNEAARLDPSLLVVWYESAAAKSATGRFAEAAALQRQLLATTNSADAAIGLAWTLAACPDPAVRSPAEAVALGEALTRAGNPFAPAQRPLCFDVLGAAYAAAGRYSDAVRVGRQALDGAREMKLDVRAQQKMAGRLRFYEAGKAYTGNPYE